MSSACQKKNNLSETITPKVTSSNNNANNSRIATTNVFDPSGKLEIKIWSAYVDGFINHGEVSVDPDFVLVGGDARVTNFSNDENNINGLLTSAYPKDDGNFSTFIGESKDHEIHYNHRLWVFAIGMKLYDPSMQPIAASYVKSHMKISKSTSGISNSPTASVNVPSGYNLLSGGAHIIWNHPGVLLTTSIGSVPTRPDVPAGWRVEGKDHVSAATGSIEAYALSFDNNIPEFGNMAFRSQSVFYGDGTSHFVGLQQNVDPDNSGYLLTGV